MKKRLMMKAMADDLLVISRALKVRSEDELQDLGKTLKIMSDFIKGYIIEELPHDK